LLLATPILRRSTNTSSKTTLRCRCVGTSLISSAEGPSAGRCHSSNFEMTSSRKYSSIRALNRSSLSSGRSPLSHFCQSIRDLRVSVHRQIGLTD
jgi:hypothetical protein